MNILFICSGNISRSFLADMLFKNEIKRRKLDNIYSASAGLHANPGSASDPKMVEYLREKGIFAEKHESRQAEGQDVDWASLILVMEKDHKMMVEASWPEAAGRVDLLGRFASDGPIVDDIIDPYRGSSYQYRLAQSQITLGVTALVESLVSDK